MTLSINNTISRNVERSFLDYFTDLFTEDGITDIRLEKSFADAYNGTLPCVVANLFERPMNSLQIGSSIDKKEFIMEIRLFCKDDGFRLFLADYLVEKIKLGLLYYEYEVTDGKITNRDIKGRIRITKITANRKEIVNIETNVLADKFRHLIRAECRVKLS